MLTIVVSIKTIVCLCFCNYFQEDEMKSLKEDMKKEVVFTSLSAADKNKAFQPKGWM